MQRTCNPASLTPSRSVYVSARRVPTEAPGPGSAIFMNLVYLGICKHDAHQAPAPPLGQGAPRHMGR